MHFINKMITVFALLFIISCSRSGKQKDLTSTSNGNNNYPTIAAAAAAAKADMLAIIDSIPLGFVKDSLVNATAGAPISCSNIDMKYILTSNEHSRFDSLPKTVFPAQVPFMGSNNRVVTVVGIQNAGNSYSIGQLVNYPLSAQLDSVLYNYNATITGIVDVYAMQARIFVTGSAAAPVYYFAINNATSPMKPLNNQTLMIKLKEEAQYYTNKFGNDSTAVYW